jgi:hypothetical protein
MRRRTVAAVLLASAAAAAVAIIITAGGGQPGGGVRLPPVVEHVALDWWAPARDDKTVVRFADNQARAYLREMGWASTRPAQGRRPRGALRYGLVVTATGGSAAEGLRSPRPAPPTDDGYTLTVGRRWARIEAASPRGLLYGVYGYLQRLGVRFFAPRFAFYRGIGNEFVPRRATDLPAQSVTSSPSFAIRRLDTVLAGGTPANTVAIVDWAAKQGINTMLLPQPGVPGQDARGWADWRSAVTPALRQRGFMLETGRVSTRLLPYARYAKAHPGWFFGGEPNKAFCVSTPGALDTYVANTIAILRRSRDLVRFDAWPPDDTVWCPRDLRQIGPPPVIQAVTLRALQAAVKRAHLRTQIETVAYDTSRTLEPPPGGLPPEMQVDFAPYNRSFAQPLWGPQNARYWKALQGWLRLHQHVGLYSYYVKGRWLSRPVLIPSLIAKELNRLAALRLNAVSSYADSRSWVAYEVNHLATAAYSWDARRPYGPFISDYAAHRFGSASVGAVREYLRQTELGARVLFTDAPGAFRSKAQLNDALDHWRAAARELDIAEAVTPRDAGATRLLDRLRVSLDLGILDAGSVAAQLAGRPASVEETAADRLLSNAAALGLVQGIVPNDFAIASVTGPVPHRPWQAYVNDPDRPGRARRTPPSPRGH